MLGPETSRASDECVHVTFRRFADTWAVFASTKIGSASGLQAGSKKKAMPSDKVRTENARPADSGEGTVGGKAEAPCSSTLSLASSSLVRLGGRSEAFGDRGLLNMEMATVAGQRTRDWVGFVHMLVPRSFPKIYRSHVHRYSQNLVL